MILKCEKVERGNNKLIEFDITANDLPSDSWFLCFGSTSPMFRLYKIKNNSEYLLYESEIRDGTDVRFKKVLLNEKKLCNNNVNQQVVLRTYNYSNFGAPKETAETRFTVTELIEGRRSFQLRSEGKFRGTANFQNVKRYTRHDFSDYLMAGMQMALVVCLDFTASNGIPSNSSSLHYTTAHKKSKYEEALKEVTNIVMDYDADKLVPTYGFGAKVRMPNFHTGTAVHHCFPLNGNTENPNFYQL